MTPKIITLEGETPVSAELLGIDEQDFELLGVGSLTNSDIKYLNKKYPEYMGIWPLLAKIGTAVSSGVGSIVKAVRERREEKKAGVSQDVLLEQQRILAEQQRMYALQVQQKKEQQKMLLIAFGVPVAAIILLQLMNRPKK